MVFTSTGSRRSIEVAIQGDASSLRSSLDAAETGLLNLRNATKLAGGALAALGAGGIAIATREAAQLETTFAEVETLMGSGADAAATFGADVRRLSTEFAAQGGELEVVEGLYQTYSAGVTNSAEATALLETALKTARAGLSDTGTAIDALTTIINAYNLETEEASRVSDILFTTVQRGKTRFPELASTIGRVIPTAAEMGVEIEEVTAAIATLTQQAGLATDEAVTALNRALTSLLKPTGDAAEVIQRMGFESGRALVEQEGFAGALERVQEHAANSSDELTDVFRNVRALRAVFPLAGKASEEFAANLERMNDSSGATNEAFQTVSDTAAFEFRQSLNRVQASLRETGDTFLPVARDILAGLDVLIQRFNGLQRETDGVAGQVAFVGSVIGGLGLVAGGPVAAAIAGIGALAAAYASDWANIRSSTDRAVADISSSLARLSETTDSETQTQIGSWDELSIRIGAGVDYITTQISQVIDDIVVLREILGREAQAIGETMAAMQAGEFGRIGDISERAAEDVRETLSERAERRRERMRGLRLRMSDYRGALSSGDMSLLPGAGRDESEPGRAPIDVTSPFPTAGTRADSAPVTITADESEAATQLADLYDEARAQTRAVTQTRDETQRTARTLADSPLVGRASSRCDIADALLDPLERAPRPAGRRGAGGGGSRTGTPAAATPGRLPRGTGLTPGREVADPIPIEADGKTIAEVSVENQRAIAERFITE